MFLYLKKKYSIAFGLRYTTHFALDYIDVEYESYTFVSTSSHNNSLSRSPISLCITSCFEVCLRITVPRLSSFHHVSDSVSVTLHLRPHPAAPSLGVGFYCEGYARELRQTVIILNSVNLAPAPRQPSRPYFLNAACTTTLYHHEGCKLLAPATIAAVNHQPDKLTCSSQSISLISLH